jgi:hypothetical protein
MDEDGRSRRGRGRLTMAPVRGCGAGKECGESMSQPSAGEQRAGARPGAGWQPARERPGRGGGLRAGVAGRARAAVRRWRQGIMESGAQILAKYMFFAECPRSGTRQTFFYLKIHFAECPRYGTWQRSLCRVSGGDIWQTMLCRVPFLDIR